VLGLFDPWQCNVAEAELEANNILAICTDGVLEAANAAGEEFGEEGLVNTLRAHPCRSAQDLLDAVIAAVKDFAPGDQADDITLLVAKAKP
jgi:sigma-B regulation protein RsbU (phosphoserine phosphatase)